MARPTKNNCDYFPHDAGMRNHKKVKAIRTKFGINGYGIWSMLLEYLTESDGNVFPYNDLEFELMSGDFGVSVTEIRSVVDYCITLEMLFNKNGFVTSESLDERLAPVYEKRGKAKELSKKQLRERGKFVTGITDSAVVSVTEKPQSKVKEIKVNESKLNESKEFIYIGETKIFRESILPILEFYEVQLNGTEKEHGGAAWRGLVDKWFTGRVGDYFADNLNVKNSFKKFYLNQNKEPTGFRKKSFDLRDI